MLRSAEEERDDKKYPSMLKIKDKERVKVIIDRDKKRVIYQF